MKVGAILSFCAFCTVLEASRAATATPGKSPATASATTPEYEGLQFIGQLTETKPHADALGGGPEGRKGVAGPTITKYYISATKMRWADAVESCKRFTKCQGHLVRIQDKEENEGIQAYIPSSKYGQYLWTDGVSGAGGTWTWAGEDGQKMSYTPTGFGPSPKQPGSAHVSIKSTGPSRLAWFSRTDPNEQTYFMCQRRVEPTDGLAAPVARAPCDKKLVAVAGRIIPKTNNTTKRKDGTPPAESTYFIVPGKMTWEKAGARCKKLTDGKGSLARIETAEQDAQIRQMIRSAAYHKIGEYLWTDGKRDRKGNWIWSSTGDKIEYVNAESDLPPAAPSKAKSKSKILAYLTVVSPTVANYEWSATEDKNEKYGFVCQTKK